MPATRVTLDEAADHVVAALKLGLTSEQWRHLCTIPKYPESFWEMAISRNYTGDGSVDTAIKIARALGYKPDAALMAEVDRRCR